MELWTWITRDLERCSVKRSIAERMLADGQLEQAVQERYRGWREPFGQELLAGRWTLDRVAARTMERNLDPEPCSGGQERLENLLNRYF